MGLLAELKRRNVIRVAIAYVLIAWVLLQGADFFLDVIGAPGWVIQALLGLAALGLPAVLLFAWIFELTPEGLKREYEVDRAGSIAPQTGRRLDRTIIVFLVLAVALLLGERFLVQRQQLAPLAEQAVPKPLARDRRSVAVLPFSFRSSNPEDEHFAEGIHDDLLTQLAKIGSLKVISRTSVMEYRDTTKKIPQIAAELGVATIVEGGVQRSGSRIRLNAQLIDASTDEHLWAESWDRELTAQNLFDIQAEIARAIARALQATLNPAVEAQLDRPLTDNLEAWESYRRAARLRLKQETPAVIAGLAEIDHALALDPGFAAAWSLKAILLLQRFWFFDPDPALPEQALAAIETGRKFDPNLPDLDLAEAYYHYWGHLDYEPALRALDRAVAAQPNDARIHEARAYVLRRMGEWEAAIAAFQRAAELSPREGLILTDLGVTLNSIKRFEEGAEALAAASRLIPDSPVLLSEQALTAIGRSGDFDAAVRYYRAAHSILPESDRDYWTALLAARDFAAALQLARTWGEDTLQVRVYHFSYAFLEGMTLLLAGDAETAIARLAIAESEFEALIAATPDQFTTLLTLCQIKGALGKTAESIEVCARAREVMPQDALLTGENLFYLAQGLALGGATAQALELLEENFSLAAGKAAHYIELHPAFDGLRDNPEFIALLKRHRDGGGQ